jgi:exosortase E/protease (VPEID-CTERM system)
LLTTEPTTEPTAATAPWRGCAVALGLLAVQVLLLDRLVGEEILTISESLFGSRLLRREILFALPFAIAVFFELSRPHLAAYRASPVEPRRLVGQVCIFALLLAVLLSMSAGIARPWIGELPGRMLELCLGLAWMASLGWLLPANTNHRATTAWTAAAGLFAAVATNAASALQSAFWRLTHRTTENIVELLITPFAGGPVIRPEPRVIGTQVFSVSISSLCSGSQGIVLIILLFTGYLWWFRGQHRFPQVLLVFPIGVMLIFLANAIRIAALVLVGIHISPRIAVDGFHSNAGWIAFLVVGLGTIWGISRIPFFARLDDDMVEASPPHAAGAGPTPSPAATPLAPAACGPSVTACLLPFLALLAATMLTNTFSTHDSIDLLYPLRVVVVAAVLWGLRREYRWREATLSPFAVGIGVATCVVWMLLAPAIVTPDPEAAARQDPAQLGMLWGSAWLLMRLVGYTITVPIAEELAFRGFLARRVVGPHVESLPVGTFTWLSFIASSVAFGLLHGAAWLPGTLAGMAFALAVYHRGRLADAIVAHATTNALIACYAVFTGSWSSLG